MKLIVISTTGFHKVLRIIDVTSILSYNSFVAHELDDPWYAGLLPNIGEPQDGDFYARCLFEADPNAFSIVKDAQFLGLAAGNANPELRLAERLSISSNRIFLLDFSYQNEVRRDGVTKIATGVFEFLEKPSKTDFSIITLIGAEFLYNQEKQSHTLAKLLPHILKPPALLCIYPEEKITAFHNNNGFRSVGNFWYQYTGY